MDRLEGITMRLTRVRAFKCRGNLEYEFGIDFIAGRKKRTVLTDKETVDRLEQLLISKGWQVTPSLFLGGYWSARKMEYEQ